MLQVYNSFIQLLNKYLLNLEFLPGIVIRAGVTVAHKTRSLLCGLCRGRLAINKYTYETDNNMKTYGREGLSGYAL